MRTALFSIVLAILGLMAGCGGSHATQQSYFPKPIKRLYLGMPMEALAQARPQLAPAQISREEFRYLWRENFPTTSELRAVTYYFDTEKDKPLYEMVISFRDLADRDAWTAKRLGSPNHSANEWRLSSAEGFVIRAWLHEDKLIFAGEIPGTEWGEDALP